MSIDLSKALHKTQANGFDICYWKTGAGKKPLLILHTLRTQIEFTERIAPLLADHFLIIVPDLPGHGRSSKALSRPYEATLFVETIATFIKEEDLSEVTVLGESIGGTIALALAAEIPERLSQVFAANPHDSTGAFIGGMVGKMISFFGRFSSLPFRLEFPALLGFILLAGFANRKNLSKDFVKKLSTVPNQDAGFPAVMQSMMKHARSWSEFADKKYPLIPNSLPVHVIYGDRDWSPKWAPEQNKRRLPEHVQFTTLPNTGHFSFLDNPKSLADIVKAAVL